MFFLERFGSPLSLVTEKHCKALCIYGPGVSKHIMNSSCSRNVGTHILPASLGQGRRTRTQAGVGDWGCKGGKAQGSLGRGDNSSHYFQLKGRKEASYIKTACKDIYFEKVLLVLAKLFFSNKKTNLNT